MICSHLVRGLTRPRTAPSSLAAEVKNGVSSNTASLHVSLRQQQLRGKATKLEIEVQPVTGSWPRPTPVFMRTCHECGQVTFWAVSLHPHEAVELVNPSDLLDGS